MNYWENKIFKSVPTFRRIAAALKSVFQMLFGHCQTVCVCVAGWGEMSVQECRLLSKLIHRPFQRALALCPPSPAGVGVGWTPRLAAHSIQMQMCGSRSRCRETPPTRSSPHSPSRLRLQGPSG